MQKRHELLLYIISKYSAKCCSIQNKFFVLQLPLRHSFQSIKTPGRFSYRELCIFGGCQLIFRVTVLVFTVLP